MKTDNFVTETKGVTRTLGRNSNLDVVFQGSQAGTNGSTIVMPALPADTELTNVQARGFRGFADHESLHVRHTDVEVFAKMFGTDKAPNQLFYHLYNAIEDVRIERIGIEEYPGIQKNLAATVELMDKHTRITLDDLEARKAGGKAKAMADFEQMGPYLMTAEGRRRMHTATDVCEAMLAEADPTMQANLKRWGDEFDKLRPGKEGSQDSVALAQKILEELGLYTPPSEDEKQKQNKGKGPTSAGGGSEDGEGAGSGAPEVQGERQDSDSTDPIEGEGGGGGVGSGGIVFQTGGKFKEPSNTTIDPNLNNAVSSEAATVRARTGSGGYKVLTTAHDKWHTRHDGPEKYGSHTVGGLLADKFNIASFDRSVSEAKSSLSVMRRKLERMVLSEQRRDWDNALEDGMLDPKRLTAASMGVKTVFRQRAPRKEIDTAMCILIDLSGSMDGEKIKLAQQVAIALSKCLETIGVTFAVYGFDGHSGYLKMGKSGTLVSTRYPPGLIDDTSPDADDQWRRLIKANGGYGRITPMDMTVFKEFDESLREARTAMGYIKHSARGDNSDGDAVQMAWDRLKKQNAKRKIMLVLSDGQPASSFTCPPIEGQGPLAWRLRTVVQNITIEGGECVGIGILSSAVKDYYPRHVVIKSLEEFASTAMDLLGKLLLKDTKVALRQVGASTADRQAA
jgi:cobaltochelatase CobT subunit